MNKQVDFKLLGHSVQSAEQQNDFLWISISFIGVILMVIGFVAAVVFGR